MKNLDKCILVSAMWLTLGIMSHSPHTDELHVMTMITVIFAFFILAD